METLLPSLRPKWTGPQVLSAMQGKNGVQLWHILSLYALTDQVIYDVTWGKGAMWTDDMLRAFKVFASDKDEDKVAGSTARPVAASLVMDFTALGYDELSGDVLILDPPYMAGKQTHQAIYDAFANENEDHDAVLRLYHGGLLSAWRVLKWGGRIIVKCQDERSGGVQRWTHCELISMLGLVGFDVVDLFVLVNENETLMSGHKHQNTARKNHSYWIVGMKPFKRPTKQKNGPPPKRKLTFNFGNESSS